MALEYNVTEAAEWDKAFAQKVLAFAEARARYEDIRIINELRAGVADDEAPPVEVGSVDWFATANAQEVVDWVGDDKDRAAAALQAENTRDEPRKKLSERLEKLLAD